MGVTQIRGRVVDSSGFMGAPMSRCAKSVRNPVATIWRKKANAMGAFRLPGDRAVGLSAQSRLRRRPTAAASGYRTKWHFAPVAGVRMLYEDRADKSMPYIQILAYSETMGRGSHVFGIGRTK